MPQSPIERLTRLSEAATIAAAHSNDEEVRATFKALALQWQSIAQALAPDTYHFKTFRYTHVEDAVAEAERDLLRCSVAATST